MNDSLKASNNMQHNFLPSFGPAFARRKRRNLSSWESVFGFLVRQWGWDDPFRWKRRRTSAYRQRISRCWFGQTSSRTCCRPLFSVVAQLSLVPIAGSPPQQFSCNFNSRDQHKESLLRGAQLQTASGESCSNNCSLICDRKSNNRDCLILKNVGLIKHDAGCQRASRSKTLVHWTAFAHYHHLPMDISCLLRHVAIWSLQTDDGRPFWKAKATRNTRSISSI